MGGGSSSLVADWKAGQKVIRAIGENRVRCRIGDYAHLAPGCTLGGDVTLGEVAFLGIGARVIPGIRIGRWSVIGAGSVVTKDIPDNCTAVGVPAKVIKTRGEVWHLK